jgi:hypothetical protein
MNTHPFIDTIIRYFKGCNTANVDLMVSCFADDVEAYFIDVEPIIGSHRLAKFWCRLHEGMGARWTIDRAVAQGNDAVVEWSMLWTPPETAKEELSRGTDWFIFENGLITEIRQYHHARGLKPGQNFELLGFPYAKRGYPLEENLDSRLPE